MTRRSYRQYCALASALDLIGERWSMLVVRELLTGPKRFTDLQEGLPGIGTSLLAARLKTLESDGIAQRVELPPPARASAYALTEAGEELAPAVLALARWGLRWSLEEEPDQKFRPGWAVLGIRAVFDPDAAHGVHATYEFRVGRDIFHVRVDDGSLEAGYGSAQHPDAVITIEPDRFAQLAAGRVDLREARAQFDGDANALRLMRNLFHWPERESRRA